ncbi:MAG TPA: glycosyltransferase family 2 protein [Thermoleophilaceae bacterium]|jgi:glycosyltransferase involved in cell wall biosynthesis
MTPAAPLASVIVCTRNRADYLEGALDSILADSPGVGWELIVVDNASTDGTRAVVEARQAEAKDVPVEYALEERLGHSHARNRGIADARGELIVFTDDDVIVEAGWLDALCAGFTEPDVMAAGGKIVPRWPSAPPGWMSARLSGVLAVTDYGEEARDLTGDEYPVGANMAIRRSALGDAASAFDTRLGHRGGGYFGFDEHELFAALRERGRLVYRPDAVVHHRILPDRMTWEGMRRASLHNGYGSMRADRLREGTRVPLRSAVPEATRALFQALRRRRRNGGRDDVDPEAAFDEFHAYWVVGRWIEILFGESAAARWLLSRLV